MEEMELWKGKKLINLYESAGWYIELQYNNVTGMFGTFSFI